MRTTIILSTLLTTWADQARTAPTEGATTPWWLDPTARLESIARAARSLGADAQTDLDPDDPGGWDITITGIDPPLVLRCVGAGVNLDSADDGFFIGDAWRVLRRTSPPPPGHAGVHLVAVMPYTVDSDGDTATAAALTAWLSVGAWCGASDDHVWAAVPLPYPQNAAGVTFPGWGLVARLVPPRL